MEYTCGVCHQKVPDDLVVYKEHTEKHIVDVIRSKHPDWSAENGVCKKCYEYYKTQMNQG